MSLSAWALPAFAQQLTTAAVLTADASLEDDGATSSDYLHRYPPAAHRVEIGVFGGFLFISDKNSFRGPATSAGGRINLQPISDFERPSPEFGVRAAYFPLSFLGGELEGMFASAENQTRDDTSILAARLHAVVQAPYWSVVPFVAGGVGYWATLSEYSGDDRDPAFHFGGGVKLAASDLVAVRLDLRDNITNRRGTNDYPHNLEVSAGASVVLGRAQPLPRDADSDGISDSTDACPLQAGDAPDGCPAGDRDGDRIVDASDQCPDQAGSAPTGCAPEDADADGVIDEKDQCVNESGPAPRGCPDGDADGVMNRDDRCPEVAGSDPFGCPGDIDEDGAVDTADQCPAEPETANGFSDADGCPDEVPDAVKSFSGVIGGIEFDLNKDTINPSSYSVLDKAAATLLAYPTLRVAIVGHTDDTGAHDYNVSLSLRRAESVKQYFVLKGIAADRFTARGAGPDEPLIAEKTEAARKKNRRIEFNVVQ